MEHILRGILRYSRNQQPLSAKLIKEASLNPAPKAVMFTCMDCRIMPHQFTNVSPGDMFVVRNPGNMIPHSSTLAGTSTPAQSCALPLASQVSCEAAALQLTCVQLGLRDVIVCGHSDCKALNLLYECGNCASGSDSAGGSDMTWSPLHAWVTCHGRASLDHLGHVSGQRATPDADLCVTFTDNNNNNSNNNNWRRQSISASISGQLCVTDQLSQIHTLQQLSNVTSYDHVRPLVDSGAVRLHALWLDMNAGHVCHYSRREQKFVPLTNEHTLQHALLEHCYHK